MFGAKKNYGTAYRTWVQLVRNYNHIERNALDLLAHPDATAEQISQVRTVLIDGRKCMRENYEIVNERLGRRFFSIPMPKFMKEEE